jgi:hypothetical protein
MKLALSLAAAAVLAAVVPTTAVAASTGTGTVFLPNPVADLQDQTLTDRKDTDYPALQRAYHDVTLTNLDGSGRLEGDWVNIHSQTGKDVVSATNTFRFHRDEDGFEQVMAYYWVTEAQLYIQSLGFGTTYPPINRESQDVRINQYGGDNSFSVDKQDVIRFGKGGVDDAEDAEVILHEYGHAMMDSQQTPFGFGPSEESGAIGEGFADYWAGTVSTRFAPTPDEACIADWDSTSYTTTVPHCLRRLDGTKHYPDDLDGEVHDDGEIWSRALWDIHNTVGATKADTLILLGQFNMPDPTMPQLAASTVDAAQRVYGNSVAKQVQQAFQARGIL